MGKRLQNGMDLFEALDKVNKLLVIDIRNLAGKSKGLRFDLGEKTVLNLKRVRPVLGNMPLPNKWVLFYFFAMPVLYAVLKK